MNVKINRFLRLYPLFAGFSMDLLFFVAVNTLFLKEAKGCSPSQIVLLTTISLVACIILQIPIVKFIKMIGNTNSVRLGTFLMLCSSLLITFGNSYYVIVFGKIVYMVALSFTNMLNAVLKNNLSAEDRDGEYIKYRTRAMSVYSGVTMFIALIAGYIFNINQYLPMYACIACCAFSFVLCFFIADETEISSKADEEKKCATDLTNESQPKKKKEKIVWSKQIILIIASFAICYAIVSSGQAESKLFIQEELYKWFTAKNVALLISLAELISRVVRLMSNLVFAKIYAVLKKNIIVYLASALAFSMSVLFITYFLPIAPTAKFILMTFGYCIILFVRDPIKSCIQEALLNNTSRENQQTLLTLLDFAYKVLYAGLGFAFSLLLIKLTLIYIIAICLVFALLGILICSLMSRLLKATTSVEIEK